MLAIASDRPIERGAKAIDSRRWIWDNAPQLDSAYDWRELNWR